MPANLEALFVIILSLMQWLKGIRPGRMRFGKMAFIKVKERDHVSEKPSKEASEQCVNSFSTIG